MMSGCQQSDNKAAATLHSAFLPAKQEVDQIQMYGNVTSIPNLRAFIFFNDLSAYGCFNSFFKLYELLLALMATALFGLLISSFDLVSR